VTDKVEKKGETYIELKISDNGQGIDLEKFGDKLFGLHKTFHTHEHARGVGLFLVKTQIESMGGSISADSEVDKGTTFTIRFRK
jgi:signal transduction histidine kinase